MYTDINNTLAAEDCYSGETSQLYQESKDIIAIKDFVAFCL